MNLDRIKATNIVDITKNTTNMQNVSSENTSVNAGIWLQSSSTTFRLPLFDLVILYDIIYFLLVFFSVLVWIVAAGCSTGASDEICLFNNCKISKQVRFPLFNVTFFILAVSAIEGVNVISTVGSLRSQTISVFSAQLGLVKLIFVELM